MSKIVEVAWLDGARMGSGVRITQKSGHELLGGKSPFQPLEEGDYKENKAIKKSEWKKKMITSAKEQSTSMKASMSVEGNGWGYSASASAEATADLKCSSDSVHVVVNAFAITSPTMVDINKLKLTETAEKILKRNLNKFHEIYGTHFVGGHKRGKTFWGALSFTKSSSESKVSLSAEMSAGGSYGGFSGAGSMKASAEKFKKSTNCQVTISMKASGGVIGVDTSENDADSLVKAAKAVQDYKSDSDVEGGNKLTAFLIPYTSLDQYIEINDGRMEGFNIACEDPKIQQIIALQFLMISKLEDLLQNNSRVLEKEVGKTERRKYQKEVKVTFKKKVAAFAVEEKFDFDDECALEDFTETLENYRDKICKMLKIKTSGGKKPNVGLSGEYKLFNQKWGGPLFCGDGTDSGGDHRVWIEPRRTYENKGKERWIIEKQSDGWYKIFNKKWGGPLFCGDGVDSGNDHHIWVEPRRTYENKGKERWEIKKQSDGFYKLWNKKWGATLFCGDSKDKGGDHYAFCEKRRKYENGGKERWTLKKC